MLHRKGIIHCSCANTLYLAQAIPWNKCNLARFSTNFKFEGCFLNDSTGHWICCGGPHADRGPVVAPHWLNQATLMQSSFTHCVACYICKLVEMYLRFTSAFWVSKCKAVFALASFHNSSAQFLSLCSVLTESCPIVIVNLQVYFSLRERILRVSDFRVFSPQLMFSPLIILKLQLIFRKCSNNGHLTGLWKEKHFW